jgi:thiamine biosynthesis lipoprotein
VTGEPAAVGRAEFPALGGLAVLLTTDLDRLEPALAAVRAEVAAIDAACSRFRPDSELSQVNASAGTPVVVGELFAQALETALRAARLTGGDVDPTCGASLVAAGYDRDFEHLRACGVMVTVTGTGAGSAPSTVPGWHAVEWDPGRRLVRIPPGSRLDFGATAKALAADRAAALAQSSAGCGVLVSLGGDISVRGETPPGGWQVRVTDDHRAAPDAPGQTVTVAEGGLATSSTTVRQWSDGERELHHIMHPGTGRPVNSCWRTVSVAAATCVDANTASTAAIVRGPEARWWLTQLGLPARLVRHDGSVHTVAGWPTEDPPAADIQDAQNGPT